ncbi:MAG: hypothetical protein OEY14_16785, partial [Myxococcales bacterium]|nr:hypothetical protein [Myxococcales bacterium]
MSMGSERGLAGRVASRDEDEARRSRAKRGEGSWHQQIEGLHVVKVQGSFYEMGFQHGQLLAEAIPHGPITYYREHAERLLGKGLGPAAPLAFAVIRKLLGGRIWRQAPRFARETMRGMADG